MMALMKETKAAQKRTGRDKLGTRVSNGKFQIVDHVKVGKKWEPVPLSDWMSFNEIIREMAKQ